MKERVEVEDLLRAAAVLQNNTKSTFKDNHNKNKNKNNENIKALNLQKYLGTQLEVLGLSSPEQRQILKTGFSFSHFHPLDAFTIWSEIWKQSEIFEAKSLAAFFLEGHCTSPLNLKLFATSKAWTHQIDNWCHSDIMSKFNACCLEDAPEVVMPVLQKWNRSRNPWARRQSIVSLVYYASSRQKVLAFDVLIALVEPLLDDTHFYVQRGTGWTLREMGNLYPQQTRDFVATHVNRLSAVAFSSATEKYTAAEKTPLKLARKLARQK